MGIINYIALYKENKVCVDKYRGRFSDLSCLLFYDYD